MTLDAPTLWRHDGAMATIQIKNVPEETHAALVQRAAAAHQSLQAYLLGRLEVEAHRPSNRDLFRQLKEVGGGNLTVETAVGTIRQDRARR